LEGVGYANSDQFGAYDDNRRIRFSGFPRSARLSRGGDPKITNLRVFGSFQPALGQPAWSQERALRLQPREFEGGTLYEAVTEPLPYAFYQYKYLVTTSPAPLCGKGERSHARNDARRAGRSTGRWRYRAGADQWEVKARIALFEPSRLPVDREEVDRDAEPLVELSNGCLSFTTLGLQLTSHRRHHQSCRRKCQCYLEGRNPPYLYRWCVDTTYDVRISLHSEQCSILVSESNVVSYYFCFSSRHIGREGEQELLMLGLSSLWTENHLALLKIDGHCMLRYDDCA
jgi:hypothetical protein